MLLLFLFLFSSLPVFIQSASATIVLNYVDNNTSDVDGSADIGTETNFAQAQAKDGLNMTLQEGVSTWYKLDMEYQWTTANYTAPIRNLCFYQTSHTGSENLVVYYWTGAVWTSIGNITSTGWTNMTATGLSSATYTIRLRGQHETSDITQDTWYLDCILLSTNSIIGSPGLSGGLNATWWDDDWRSKKLVQFDVTESEADGLQILLNISKGSIDNLATDPPTITIDSLNLGECRFIATYWNTSTATWGTSTLDYFVELWRCNGTTYYGRDFNLLYSSSATASIPKVGQPDRYGNVYKMQDVSYLHVWIELPQSIIGTKQYNRTAGAIWIYYHNLDYYPYLLQSALSIYDVDGDGDVDLDDLACVVAHYREVGPPGWIPEDINRDGSINSGDISALVSHLGFLSDSALCLSLSASSGNNTFLWYRGFNEWMTPLEWLTQSYGGFPASASGKWATITGISELAQNYTDTYYGKRLRFLQTMRAWNYADNVHYHDMFYVGSGITVDPAYALRARLSAQQSAMADSTHASLWMQGTYNNVAYTSTGSYQPNTALDYYTEDALDNYGNHPDFETTTPVIYGSNWWCQEVTPTHSVTNISGVCLKMYRFGSPGTITVSIRTTKSGGDLRSVSRSANTFTTLTTGRKEWFNFSSSLILTGSAHYYIIVRVPGGSMYLNWVRWLVDAGNPNPKYDSCYLWNSSTSGSGSVNTMYDKWNEDDEDGETAIRIYQTTKASGEFICTNDFNLSQVRLQLQRVGSVSGNFKVSVRSSSAGGTILTSQTISANALGTSKTWVTFGSLSSTIHMSIGTHYWITTELVSGGGDYLSNYISVFADAGSEPLGPDPHKSGSYVWESRILDLTEHWNTGDDDWDWAGGTRWISQEVNPGTTGPSTAQSISVIQLKMYRHGSPGTVTVRLRNSLTGSNLGSATLNGNTFTTSTTGTFQSFVFSPSVSMSTSNYFIIISAASGDSSNYVGVNVDVGSGSSKSSSHYDSGVAYDNLFSGSGSGTILTEYYDSGLNGVGDGNKPRIHGPNWEAQEVAPGTKDGTDALSITRVDLCLNKKGSPGTATLYIRTSLTGSNLGTATASSFVTDPSTSWVPFTFSGVNIPAGTSHYYLVLKAPSGTSSSYINWVHDAGSTSGTNYDSAYLWRSTNSGSSFVKDKTMGVWSDSYGTGGFRVYGTGGWEMEHKFEVWPYNDGPEGSGSNVGTLLFNIYAEGAWQRYKDYGYAHDSYATLMFETWGLGDNWNAYKKFGMLSNSYGSAWFEVRGSGTTSSYGVPIPVNTTLGTIYNSHFYDLIWIKANTNYSQGLKVYDALANYETTTNATQAWSTNYGLLNTIGLRMTINETLDTGCSRDWGWTTKYNTSVPTLWQDSQDFDLIAGHTSDIECDYAYLFLCKYVPNDWGNPFSGNPSITTPSVVFDLPYFEVIYPTDDANYIPVNPTFSGIPHGGFGSPVNVTWRFKQYIGGVFVGWVTGQTNTTMAGTTIRWNGTYSSGGSYIQAFTGYGTTYYWGTIISDSYNNTFYQNFTFRTEDMMIADFTFTIIDFNNRHVQFNDTSFSTLKIDYWNWLFDHSGTSHIQNPYWTFGRNGLLEVTLEIENESTHMRSRVTKYVNLTLPTPAISFVLNFDWGQFVPWIYLVIVIVLIYVVCAFILRLTSAEDKSTLFNRRKRFR